MNYFKTLLNSLNYKTYIRYINKLKYESKISNKYNITRYALETKKRNRKIFLNKMRVIRIKQFFYIFIPAVNIIFALSGFIFGVPKKEVDKNVKLYNKYEITYDNEGNFYGGVNEELYYNKTFGNIDFKDKEHTYINNSDCVNVNKTKIRFEITDGINSYVANLSINDDAKLIIDKVNTGYFLNDYSKLKPEDIDEEFLNLFDKILDIVLNNPSRSTDYERNLLKELTKSEKRRLIISMSKYIEKGDITVKVEKNIFIHPLLLSIITIIYCIIIYFINNHIYIINGNKLKIEDGQLLIDSEEDYNIYSLYDMMQIKQTFLDAEEQRLELLANELESVEEKSKSLILTKYEKKIIEEKQSL